MGPAAGRAHPVWYGRPAPPLVGVWNELLSWQIALLLQCFRGRRQHAASPPCGRFARMTISYWGGVGRTVPYGVVGLAAGPYHMGGGAGWRLAATHYYFCVGAAAWLLSLSRNGEGVQKDSLGKMVPQLRSVEKLKTFQVRCNRCGAVCESLVERSSAGRCEMWRHAAARRVARRGPGTVSSCAELE